MVMPEHKNRILDDSLKEEVRSKPDLDPQALAEISQVLAQSLEDCSPITITLFGEYEDRSIHGIVMRVEQHLRQIKFRQGDDWEWIKVADIIKVST